MHYVMFQPTFAATPYDLHVDKGQLPLRLAQRAGWRVTVAATAVYRLPGGLGSVGMGEGRWNSLRCIWRIAGDTDVLQLHNFSWRCLARAVVYKLRNPRGVCYLRLSGSTAATLARDIGRLQHPAYRILLRLGLPSIDLISSESRGLLERFEAFTRRAGLRRMPARLIVSSCGFPPDEVLPRLQPGPSGTDILFVGRLGAPEKALNVLLSAFQQLREQRGVPATLRLVGDGGPAFEEQFARWAAGVATATAHAVSCPGATWDREALLRHYLDARVFAICSRMESGPNVFVEAASAGCLLTGTPVGMVPDVCDAVGTGWITPVGDAHALAEALAAALRAPDSLEARRERIRRFNAAYSWPDTVDRLAAQLEDLSRAKRGGGGRARVRAPHAASGS